MPDTAQNTSSAALRTGYDPVHFARLAAVEERHFWFKTRRSLIASFVRKVSRSLPPGYRVLEIGCGTGNVLGALEVACPSGVVFGLDRFAEGLAFAAQRGRRWLVQGDAHFPPFRTQFELIGAFDIIEHLPDDTRILADIHDMVRPGGHVIITVPASKRLWSKFDDIAHHYRRYEKRELKSKIRNAGFECLFVSPFMMSTVPLLWLHRKQSGAQAANDVRLVEQETRIIPVVNRVLQSVLALECSIVAAGVPLPFGSSLIAVARKA